MLIIKTHIKGHTLLRQDGEGQIQAGVVIMALPTQSIVVP